MFTYMNGWIFMVNVGESVLPIYMVFFLRELVCEFLHFSSNGLSSSKRKHLLF